MLLFCYQYVISFAVPESTSLKTTTYIFTQNTKQLCMKIQLIFVNIKFYTIIILLLIVCFIALYVHFVHNIMFSVYDYACQDFVCY